jgi:hypothetical protein
VIIITVIIIIVIVANIVIMVIVSLVILRFNGQVCQPYVKSSYSYLHVPLRLLSVETLAKCSACAEEHLCCLVCINVPSLLRHRRPLHEAAGGASPLRSRDVSHNGAAAGSNFWGEEGIARGH